MSNEILRALLTARANPSLAELTAYRPDPAEGAIRLDANEAPSILPTLSDAERTAWNEAITNVDPARYPDVRAEKLRAVLAEKHRVDPNQLVIGCGSDEVISILLSTIGAPVDGDPPLVLVPSPTFVMYRVSARLHGYEVAEVPLDARCDLDESKLGDAIAKLRPAVLFLATPNNPTSRAFDRGKLERLVEIAGKGEPPTLVVIDEAYADYHGAPSAVELLERNGHVVVFRTLSKIGFAGLRVGWAIARAELAKEMEKARLPYDVPSISQAAAHAALTTLAPAVDRHVKRVIAERARLTKELEGFDAVSFPRADANFFWLKVRGGSPADVAAKLKEKGVIVRTHAKWGDHLRVTVGEAKENDRFLEALRGALS